MLPSGQARYGQERTGGALGSGMDDERQKMIEKERIVRREALRRRRCGGEIKATFVRR
jgi:hypothetical protein